MQTTGLRVSQYLNTIHQARDERAEAVRLFALGDEGGGMVWLQRAIRSHRQADAISRRGLIHRVTAEWLT